MLLKRYMVSAICVLALGLCACDRHDAGDVTQSEIKEENIAESVDKVETTATEVKAENEELPDAERIVYGQSFDVNLEGWGDVTFVTYKPENEGGDAEYKLFQNGKEVYKFESWEQENYVATKAVAFRDYNGDGYKDVIIISQYKDVYEQTTEYYDTAKVFICQ